MSNNGSLISKVKGFLESPEGAGMRHAPVQRGNIAEIENMGEDALAAQEAAELLRIRNHLLVKHGAKWLDDLSGIAHTEIRSTMVRLKCQSRTAVEHLVAEIFKQPSIDHQREAVLLLACYAHLVEKGYL